MLNQHKCPYCGKEFAEKLELGIHISEEHTDESENIGRAGKTKDKNIIEDEWK